MTNLMFIHGAERKAVSGKFYRVPGVPLIKLDQVIYEDQRGKIFSEADNLRFCKINRILLIIRSSGLLSRTFGDIVYLFAVNKRSCLLVFTF